VIKDAEDCSEGLWPLKNNRDFISGISKCAQLRQPKFSPNTFYFTICLLDLALQWLAQDKYVVTVSMNAAL
jgi:hypothetical protein